MHDPQGLGPAAAGLLEVVARLLVQELDRPAIDALCHEDLLPLLEQLEPGVAEYLRGARDHPERIEELAAEFCRIFLMNKATSPMLSVWLGGDRLENAAALTAKVNGWQESLGVELAEGPWGNLPRDHLAVALGLYSLAMVSEVDGAAETAAEIAASTLRPAVPGFAAAVCESSTNPVYRAGVRLLTSLIS